MSARGSVTAALAPFVTLHEKWADTPTEDLDPLTMWEELGRVLGVLS